MTGAVEKGFKSGFVAIIGRPNVGKSTLMNTLVKRKVAIVSSKPQTTRHRISGVVNIAGGQIILFDTPGLHKPRDPLGTRLNATVRAALADVDAVLFMVDAEAGLGGGDRFIARELARIGTPKLICLNKTDTVSEADALGQANAAAALIADTPVFPISAAENIGLEEVLAALMEIMPEGPRYFPEGMLSDQPEKVLMAELVREELFERMREEVPYAIAVVVDEVDQDPKSEVVKVYAQIYVERDSQKAMVIGAKGENLKVVGTNSREAMERLFGNRIYLELRVKVKKGWRRDERALERLGY